MYHIPKCFLFFFVTRLLWALSVLLREPEHSQKWCNSRCLSPPKHLSFLPDMWPTLLHPVQQVPWCTAAAAAALPEGCSPWFGVRWVWSDSVHRLSLMSTGKRFHGQQLEEFCQGWGPGRSYSRWCHRINPLYWCGRNSAWYCCSEHFCYRRSHHAHPSAPGCADSWSSERSVWTPEFDKRRLGDSQQSWHGRGWWQCSSPRCVSAGSPHTGSWNSWWCEAGASIERTSRRWWPAIWQHAPPSAGSNATWSTTRLSLRERERVQPWAPSVGVGAVRPWRCGRRLAAWATRGPGHSQRNWSRPCSPWLPPSRTGTPSGLRGSCCSCWWWCSNLCNRTTGELLPVLFSVSMFYFQADWGKNSCLVPDLWIRPLRRVDWFIWTVTWKNSFLKKRSNQWAPTGGTNDYPISSVVKLGVGTK